MTRGYVLVITGSMHEHCERLMCTHALHCHLGTCCTGACGAHPTSAHCKPDKVCSIAPPVLLQAFVVGRLQDSKVEVRSLSAATLSGIIKALPAHEIDLLRQRIISQVHKLFATAATGRQASRGRATGTPVVAAAATATRQQQGAAFLSEAQAVVQGLKAFVLSSPYDVPGWMPEVLMALVAAANSRNATVSGQLMLLCMAMGVPNGAPAHMGCA